MLVHFHCFLRGSRQAGRDACGGGLLGAKWASPCSLRFPRTPCAQTLSALTLGTSTLRTVLASPTLQLDNISELTSALDEQLVSAQEVSEAVDAVGAPEREAAIDENEVEEEWEKLVKEEEEREERQRVEEAKRKLETPAPVPASTSQAEEVEFKTETPADTASKEPVPAQ